MGKVAWSDSAKDDLSDIHTFIADDSITYADLVVDRLIDYCAKLENFPRIGRKVSELNHDSVRELIEGNYRIVYSIDHDFIHILRVIHTSRNQNG